MPDLTFPVEFPVSNGDTIVADDLNNFFYSPVNPDESLGIINGLLDFDNLDPSLEVTYSMTQRGSHVDMCGSSGTANLDYKGAKWFQDVEPIPLPGGCRSYYCKWEEAQCLVMWTVFAQNIHDSDDETASIKLTLDGDDVDAESRLITYEVFDDSSFPPSAQPVFAYKKARVWSGHAVLEIEKGWHDIGLLLTGITGGDTITAVRIHAISIDICCFKNDSGLFAP